MPRSTVLLLLGLAASPVSDVTAQVGTTDVRIALAHGSAAEATARTDLEALLAEHDVERWIETRRVVVDEEAIPHSHPVLTVSTRYRDDPRRLMATFLHEQFHWLVNRRPQAEADAMAAFRAIWPDAPGREGRGARDQASTYLHLVVCDLEYQALTVLYGDVIARRILRETTHYEWIYERVLDDGRVREINERFGFVVS